jgi:hypothetical protein
MPTSNRTNRQPPRGRVLRFVNTPFGPRRLAEPRPAQHPQIPATVLAVFNELGRLGPDGLHVLRVLANFGQTWIRQNEGGAQ